MEDNETTYAQLLDRVQKTIDAIKTAKKENFDGKEDAEVSMFDGKYKFTGLSYLQVKVTQTRSYHEQMLRKIADVRSSEFLLPRCHSLRYVFWSTKSRLKSNASQAGPFLLPITRVSRNHTSADNFCRYFEKGRRSSRKAGLLGAEFLIVDVKQV